MGGWSESDFIAELSPAEALTRLTFAILHFWVDFQALVTYFWKIFEKSEKGNLKRLKIKKKIRKFSLKIAEVKKKNKKK